MHIADPSRKGRHGHNNRIIPAFFSAFKDTGVQMVAIASFKDVNSLSDGTFRIGHHAALIFIQLELIKKSYRNQLFASCHAMNLWLYSLLFSSRKNRYSGTTYSTLCQFAKSITQTTKYHCLLFGSNRGESNRAFTASPPHMPNCIKYATKKLWTEIPMLESV